MTHDFRARMKRIQFDTKVGIHVGFSAFFLCEKKGVCTEFGIQERALGQEL